MSLTQQVQNQARLETEHESDNVKKKLSRNTKFSVLQVKVKNNSWKACIHSDCQHNISTEDGRNAMDSTILEEFANS